MESVTQVIIPIERAPKILSTIETKRFGNCGWRGYASKCKMSEENMEFLIHLVESGDYEMFTSAANVKYVTIAKKKPAIEAPKEEVAKEASNNKALEIDLSKLLNAGGVAMLLFHDMLINFKSTSFPGFQWQLSSPNISMKSCSAVTIRPNFDSLIDIFGGKVFEIDLSPNNSNIQTTIVITPRLLLSGQGEVKINFMMFTLNFHSSISLGTVKEVKVPLQALISNNEHYLGNLIDTFNTFAAEMANAQLDTILSEGGVVTIPKILSDRQKELHHNLVEVLVKTLSLEITEKPTDLVKAKLELLQTLVNPTIYPFYNQSTGLRALIKNLVTKNA